MTPANQLGFLRIGDGSMGGQTPVMTPVVVCSSICPSQAPKWDLGYGMKFKHALTVELYPRNLEEKYG